MTKRRKYYTLCERTPGQLFAPQFGDYNKQVVIQERRDMKDSGSFIKGTEFEIIETTVSQKAIMEACEALNTPAVKAKALKESKPKQYIVKGNAEVLRKQRLLEGLHPGTMADKSK